MKIGVILLIQMETTIRSASTLRGNDTPQKVCLSVAMSEVIEVYL